MIEWVTVGDPGNKADTQVMSDGTTGYGSVAYEFRIGKYEVTNAQYCAFLNAVAAVDDPYGLYNTEMWSKDYGCKIERSGSPGNYTYSVAADRANRPVNYVSFWDAARFANWMHNGQPAGLQGPGTTEDGAYINIGDQANFSRQPGALFSIPTEDEWYKAAYYKGGGKNAGYWDYQTQSDTAPTSEAPPGTDLLNGSANYKDGSYVLGWPYYTTEVGAYMASPSAYGTFDQGGNYWEWNEAVIEADYRGLRGGSWYSDSAGMLAASYRFKHAPYTYPEGNSSLGFRLASRAQQMVVPEPFSLAFMASAFTGVVTWGLRRRSSRRTR